VDECQNFGHVELCDRGNKKDHALLWAARARGDAKARAQILRPMFTYLPHETIALKENIERSHGLCPFFRFMF
jgi:hypothetical protein